MSLKTHQLSLHLATPSSRCMSSIDPKRFLHTCLRSWLGHSTTWSRARKSSKRSPTSRWECTVVNHWLVMLRESRTSGSESPRPQLDTIRKCLTSLTPSTKLTPYSARTTPWAPWRMSAASHTTMTMLPETQTTLNISSRTSLIRLLMKFLTSGSAI